MKVKCICGNLMYDEDPQTCKTYSGCLNQDYYDVLEKSPSSVEELVDTMPFSSLFWKCNYCGRLHFFGNSKIQVFKLEQEIPD